VLSAMVVISHGLYGKFAPDQWKRFLDCSQLGNLSVVSFLIMVNSLARTVRQLPFPQDFSLMSRAAILASKHNAPFRPGF
jgi:hypothetical protein